MRENYAMLEQLRRLVECESPTDDLESCRRVINLASTLSHEQCGDAGEISDVQGRPVFWLGSKKPEVVLLCHLDTVWPIGSFNPVWKVEGDIVRGPGIYDMKAGFIQALFAMKELDRTRVALIATTDEETGSATSRQLIEDVSKNAKAVLVLESAIDGKLKIGRKGTSWYRITIHGRAAHAGLEPEKGVNATVEVAKIVNDLTKLENKSLGTSVVPTTMNSGTTTNTVPALATLDIDSRSFSLDEMKRIDDAIRSIKPLHPEAKIEITGGINRPPLEPTAADALYAIAEKLAKDAGISSLGSASVGGASDGNFAAQFTQVLDGLGAVGDGAHANHEHILASTLAPRSKLLTLLVKEILK